jgi:hypothetical protein
LGHHKSRNPREIRTVHQRRTRGSNRRHRGKSRQEVVDRRLGHRDIGDPGDKVFMQDGIAKSETPMSGSQLSAQQTRKEAPLCGPAVNMAENRGLRDRQSRRQMFFDI